MESYFLYITNKIQEIRFGKPKQLTFCDLSEVKTWLFWRAVMAEYVGTLLFVFLASQSTIPLDGTPQLFTKTSFANGLAITAVVQIFKHDSFALVNPAVTLALVIAGTITPVRTVFYIIAQTAGGITAGFILKGVTPTVFHNDLGLNIINPEINFGQAIGIEIIMTFVLVFVVLATTDHNRRDGGGIAIIAGLTVAGLHLTGETFTRTSLNPAKSFGTDVASNNYTDIWVFWVAPITGGILASVSYKFIFSPYRHRHHSASSGGVSGIKHVQDDGPIVIPKEYFKGQ